MKRLSLLIFLGFALSTAFTGCVAGPGVEPPRIYDRADENGPAGAGMSTQTPDHVTPGAGGSQTTAGTVDPTAATGGVGGTTVVGGTGGADTAMDASVDGAILVDSGARRDAEIDDDAGSEQ